MNRITLFILTMAIAFSTLLLHQMGHLAVVEDRAASFFVVVQQPLSGGSEVFGTFLDTLGSLGSLRAEKERLQQEVEQLRRENIELRVRAEEVTQLRERLKLAQSAPGLELLSADIVGWNPTGFNQTLTINRGTEHQLEEGMSVITTDGLVGRITKVHARTAKVQLLVDSNSAVQGMVVNEQQAQQSIASNTTGVVQGHGVADDRLGTTLTMRYIPLIEKVAINDFVYTSGIGANYPKGLIIGRVVAVKRNDIETHQEARVKPSVDFSRLDHVFIILNFKPTKLE